MLAVSGAGPITQQMQTERAPGIHSTTLVGHYIVGATLLPVAGCAGSRDQKQGHEQCAREPQEVSDGVPYDIPSHSAGEYGPDYLDDRGQGKESNYSQREPKGMSVIVHHAQRDASGASGRRRTNLQQAQSGVACTQLLLSNRVDFT